MNTFSTQLRAALALLFGCLGVTTLAAQKPVDNPQLLNHQGRIAVDGVHFAGTGQFKFALVNGGGSVVWSNAPLSANTPKAAVELTVDKGLYSVLLGDMSRPNMAGIPAALFSEQAVLALRVWFNDGINGFQLITPDQPLASAPFAVVAQHARTATEAISASTTVNFTGNLAGDVTGKQFSTAISDSTVTGKALTGYSSSSGTVTAKDSILKAIGKLNGNDALKAPLASPTFTGTVTGNFRGPLNGNANTATTATRFSGVLAGEVTGTQSATAIAAATVTGKALTGYSSAVGTVSASDSILKAIGKLNGNDGLKAPLQSPAFTGTVTGITKGMVGLGAVDNTSDLAKPISALTRSALDGKQAAGDYATLVGGTVPPSQLPSFVDDVVDYLAVASFPAVGETGKLYVSTSTATLYRWSGSGYTAISASASPGTSDNVPEGVTNLYHTEVRAAAAAPVQSVAGRTGSVTLSKDDVGLGSVDNTPDAAKPISSAQQAALDLKAGLDSPAFTGTVTGSFDGPLDGNATTATTAVTATTAMSFSGPLAGEVTGTQSATAIAAATVTGKALTGYASGAGAVSGSDSILTAIGKLNGNDGLKAPLESPAFTGTVTGITKGMVGLGAVDNTSDLAKPISALTQSALDGKQAAGDYATLVGGTVPASQLPSFVDDVVDYLAVASFPAVGETGKLYVSTSTATLYRWSGSGYTAISASASPGTSDNVPEGVTNLYHTEARAAAAAPVQSVAGRTGSVTLSKDDVGLGSVDNTPDAAKPISSAQQAALDLKAGLDSPTFTGSVQLPAGTATTAPLQLASGANLTAPVFGSVEFDGTHLYLTNDAANPTRRTLAFAEEAGVVSLAEITAAPVLPVLAWGKNSNGQTTVPALAEVAAVAAGENHSLALLDSGNVVAWGNAPVVPAEVTSVLAIAAGRSHNVAVRSDGTVVAWGGDNSYGQRTVPSGITNAVKAAAGEFHSLVLLSSGAVRAWGYTVDGNTTVPDAATDITAIAAGHRHSLALKADGTVIAWGLNTEGCTTVPTGLSHVVAIAAGAYHSLAVKSDGTVVAWGYDNAGQSTVPAGLTGVTEVAGGSVFSVALKNDGTLVVWGDNTYGQKSIPAAATHVIHVAAGADHLLALRADVIPAQVARLDQDNVFTGKVGIKRTPATNALEVEGNASKTVASSWLANSDRRIKTDITTVTGALEKMDRVRLVGFRYTDEYRAAHPGIDDRHYLNVIAQEFAEVFPEHVKESGEFLSDGSPVLQVDTYPLTIYSAAAVQELHRENEMLKRKLADQEIRLRKLEAFMETP